MIIPNDMVPIRKHQCLYNPALNKTSGKYHFYRFISINPSNLKIMEATIKAIHFDASEKLVSFINKKIDKLAHKSDSITGADVVMKVVKPETAANKEVQIKLKVNNSPELFASKIADTFEEAFDNCLDALKTQLEKIKSRN